MRAQAGSTMLVPFVGRGGEVSLLAQRAEEARAGQPQVLLVEGEAGFGKSALLTHFLAGLDGTCRLRASGDEAECRLPYGVVNQLVTAAGAQAAGPAAEPVPPQADPLAAGADLVRLLNDLQRAGSVTVISIDDLHWADPESAAALLFALRRLQAGGVMAVLTAVPGGPARLGEGWHRFLSGDYRVSRVRLGGLDAAEISELAKATGAAGMSPRAAGRLRELTRGSPLYCRMLLEETEPGQWDRDLGSMQVPRTLAGIIEGRMRGLSSPARQLVEAAAVLGPCAGLAAATALAGIDEPASALDEAVRSGLLDRTEGPDGHWLVFADKVAHRAVYGGIGAARLRSMHQRAAGVVPPESALAHRFAAATGPHTELAYDLEAAAREAAAEGGLARAASWLVKAAVVSGDEDARDRLLLDALEAMLSCGDVTGTEALSQRLAELRPSPRRSLLLGQCDLLAGRIQCAEDHLTRAWETRDQDRDAVVDPCKQAHLETCIALQFALCRAQSGRQRESIEWAERAARRAEGAGALERHALGVLAAMLATAQRGPEALRRLSFLAMSPAEIPLAITDVLVSRGMVRVMTGDLASGVTDLSSAAGRLAAGTPLRYADQCLGYLAGAEYLLGHWDDALAHGEHAVSRARDGGRRGSFALVHGLAALAPAARGEWDTAAAHVAAAGEAARELGAGPAVAAWASARAALAAARADHDEVLRAAEAVRVTGRGQTFAGLLLLDWRPLEVAALLGVGEAARAQEALARLTGSLTGPGPASARMIAEWLRGTIAAEQGDAAAADGAFASAASLAGRLPLPFHLARLEMADGRRLRQAGRRPEAIARLRAARSRLVTLGAKPYLTACDAELSACGVQVKGAAAPEALGLTPTELAVARLVAGGRSNREAAAELFVSVKAIEFHLGNIFAKLGIRSRLGIVEKLGESLAGHTGS